MTAPKLTLDAVAAGVLDTLTEANVAFAERYAGAPESRQPTHTVYGGAQSFTTGLAGEHGREALESLEAFAPDPFSFARALGMKGADTLPEKKKAARRLIERVRRDPATARRTERDAWLAVTVYDRVRTKLMAEPIEDFRIDFEDGFGHRPDDEEDAAAIRTALAVADAFEQGTLPPFIGIRIKPLNEELKHRSARTLDLFLTTLVERLGGRLPEPLLITLPKVPVPEQVSALATLLDHFEQAHGLDAGTIRIELMIELPQTLFDAEGRFQLAPLVDAARGRCTGAHFGTYDYTATNEITASYQTMAHGVCQLALGLMKVAYSGTPILLSDGATNVMPVPKHRGAKLSKEQRRENRSIVHNAWQTSYRHIRASLENGVYQGWDMHPAQLPVRYAATYAFFLDGFDAAAARFSMFVDKAARATQVGDVFDDAATGQALLNYFLRALNAGAVSLEDLSATGLSNEEIATRSFRTIIEDRSAN